MHKENRIVIPWNNQSQSWNMESHLCGFVRPSSFPYAIDDSTVQLLVTSSAEPPIWVLSPHAESHLMVAVND